MKKIEMLFAILNEKNEVVECDLHEYGRMFNDINRRRVANTYLENGVHVSTVFLGSDHGYDGVSKWFESMVFGLEGDDEIQERYETWDEAVEGHNILVRRMIAKHGCKIDRHEGKGVLTEVESA